MFKEKETRLDYMKGCGKTTHQCPEMSQEKKSNIVIAYAKKKNENTGHRGI